MNLRIGQGVDVHAFAERRRLILGGVEIPSSRGLAGHSDADVLTHAICDALLGAAGLGDIGHFFPDDDERYKDANSMDLLAVVMQHVAARGMIVVNIDATILAQEPRLAPYMQQKKEVLARVAGIDASRIGLKATTTEHLGFTGRKEGMAALAVVLLECQSSPLATGASA